MAQPKTLNERQIEVLRWIGDGCPGGVMTDEAHPERISAGALARRGYVTTRGRGATWSAAITTEGRGYLERVDGPNPPLPRRPNLSAWRKLLDDLDAAGGQLRVDNSTPLSDVYKRGAEAAERAGHVPKGKRIVLSVERRSNDWLDRGNLIIELVDLPEGAPDDVTPFEVPDTVHRYHPIVREFRERKEAGRVSDDLLPRASRILQAMVNESVRRGYAVSGFPAERRSRHHPAPLDLADLVVSVDATAVGFRLREDGVKHEKYLKGYEWRARRAGTPSGVLRLTVVGPYSSAKRKSEWWDGRAGSLDEQLPNALMEAELRAADQREHQRLKLEEEARRQVQWDEAMVRARSRFVEHLRAETLEAQVGQWRRAERVRQFVNAVRTSRTADAEAESWAAWAEAFADSIDPLLGVLAIPEEPGRIGPTELAPFADGWNPYLRGARG